MEQKNLNGNAAAEQNATNEAKKPWNAPQLTTVSIADLTEHRAYPGNDGGATSTRS
ncbi:MAG: hypothetical protein R8K20_06250 [Gallionellaceae bacterium]